MGERIETENGLNTKTDAPILRLNRISYVKVSGKVLDTTAAKLDKYIEYATEKIKTEINSGDCLEHGLQLLFDRDAGFKNWLKQS